ncbi:hypothetical protein AB0C34_20990 [Nocardia sp. NPDC049220]|uniref:hypothetical protein n=1 Tax=Nocardia sp. NPDC049220 TaxID=3155273 RepID=UPI003409496C
MSTGIGNWINENTPGFNDRKKPEGNPLIEDGTDYRDEYFQETVFWLHDIGLKQDEKTGVPGFLSGTIAGDAWEAYANLKNAKTFEAILGGIEVGVTGYDACYDPFGFAGDLIAGWMLTHAEPYRKVLDAFAGNDNMVQAYSVTWSKIAKELTDMSVTWKSGVEADIATWTGQAGDAYRSRAGDLIDQIAGAGGIAASLGETMDIVSKIVKAFRKLVQDILTSLVGALIGYTIELALTACTAAPHVVSAVLLRFGRDSMKISALLTEMAGAFKDVHTLAQAVTAVIYAVLGKQNQPEQA